MKVLKRIIVLTFIATLLISVTACESDQVTVLLLSQKEMGSMQVAYEYDKYGNLLRETTDNGMNESYYIYTYDAAGHWIERTHYANNRKRELVEREYDQDGCLIKKFTV